MIGKLVARTMHRGRDIMLGIAFVLSLLVTALTILQIVGLIQ